MDASIMCQYGPGPKHLHVHPAYGHGLPSRTASGHYLSTHKEFASSRPRFYDSHGSLVMGQGSGSITQTSSLDTDQWHEVNKKEIYKKVRHWFAIWQPWQQKFILHGITTRCSTNQLEALATTLEPVFHRDFMNFHLKLYPLIPVHVSTPASRPNITKLRRKSKSSTTPSPLPSLNLPNKKSRDGKKMKEPSMASLLSIDERVEQKLVSDTGKSVVSQLPETKKDVINVDLNTSEDHRGSDELNQFATEFVERILQEVLEEHFKPVIKDEYDLAHYISERVITHALGSFRTSVVKKPKIKEEDGINDIFEVTDALGNLILTKSTKTTLDIAVNNSQTSDPEEQQSLRKESVETEKPGDNHKNSAVQKGRSFTPRRKSLTPGTSSLSGSHTKSRRNSRSSQKISRAYSQVYPEKTLPMSTATPLKDIIQRELTRLKQTGLKHRVDSVDLVLADKSVDRRFGTQHHNSYSKHSRSRTLFRDSSAASAHGSPMMKSIDSAKAEIRTGLVHKPSLVHDLHIPLRKYAGLPRYKASLKPDKSILRDQFNTQAENVWNWMSDWADFEKLTLLSEIIKLCGTELMKYLAQCLFERLKERLAINWLPDHLLLLIFSKLSSENIRTCSQVCKRWKYICSMDELWMIKCLEYGQSENIHDLIQRVIDANEDNQGIDWKLAFFELQRITRDTKSALAKPNPIHIVFEPQEDSVEIVSSKVEVPLKRGTAAQLCRESLRLKRGFSSTMEEDQWWGQREARSGLGSHSPESLRSPRSTIASLPNISNRGKKDGPLANSLYDGSAYSSYAESSLGTRITGKGPESQIDGSPRLARTQLGVSMDNMTSIGSEAAKGYEKLETKAVMQWIRGRSKPGKGDGDIALDVRPDLAQAPDILGKCQSSYTLQWKDEDSKTSRKFAGKVPGVQKVRKFQGHMDAVLCVGLSKRRLISGSSDRSIRIWDIKSGRSIHKMYGHKGAVTCLLFTNNVLYTGSWDMTVMVWELVKFSRRAVLHGHKGSISCLAINEKYLFTASHDSTVRVWYRHTATLSMVLPIHQSHVMGLHVDGSNIITASSDKTIRITDYLTGQCTKLVSNHPVPIHRMIVSGHLVITSSLTGRVYFWNKTTGEAEAGIQAHAAEHPINAMDIHDGRLFTASGDQTVKEWDLFTMTCVRYLQGHKTPINDFKIVENRMVSCSSDGQIRIWDMDMDTKSAEITDDTIPYEIINQRDLGLECDHEPQQDLDEQQRFSALEQLQDVYHEDKRLRELENYKRGRGDSERLNSREGWDRENDWERDPSYV